MDDQKKLYRSYLASYVFALSKRQAEVDGSITADISEEHIAAAALAFYDADDHRPPRSIREVQSVIKEMLK
jgi:hypothetical protein